MMVVCPVWVGLTGGQFRQRLFPMKKLFSGFRAATVDGKAAGIRLKDLTELRQRHDIADSKEIICQVTKAVRK